jgi:thioredoxin 1
MEVPREKVERRRGRKVILNGNPASFDTFGCRPRCRAAADVDWLGGDFYDPSVRFVSAHNRSGVAIMAQNVSEFTDQNFESEVLKSSVPVLVDFWAEWCMPCKMLAPTIEKLATDYAGKVKVGKLDTDSNRDVSIKYGISAIPTVILFKDGQVAQKFVGLRNERDFKEALANVGAK